MLSSLLLVGALAIPVPTNTGLCLNAEEAELVRLTNEYRVQNGKPPLPVSLWLSTTGQFHTWDMMTNNALGGVCNLHSWSNSPPPGVTWQGMCYTSDHAQAAQMYAKPSQISNNLYTGLGFEVASVSGGEMNAITALGTWMFSPAHRDVILNQGAWAGVTFTGVGVGIVGNFGVMWFSNGPTDGSMPACLSDAVFSNGFE